MTPAKRQCDTCKHREACKEYKEAQKDNTRLLFGCTAGEPEGTEAQLATSELERRITRLEKTIEHILRGVRVEIKEVTGHGLTEEEILFLRDSLNSIRDDLYGEENVHYPLPEEPKDE